MRRSGGVALQVKLPRARLVRDNLHGAIIRPLHARDFAASAATRQKPCTGHPFSFGRSCALDQCRQAWSYLTTRHRRHRLVRSERSIGPGLTGGPDEPCQLRYAPIIFFGHETCITPRARSDRARLRHERVRRGQQAATRASIRQGNPRAHRWHTIAGPATVAPKPLLQHLEKLRPKGCLSQSGHPTIWHVAVVIVVR